MLRSLPAVPAVTGVAAHPTTQLASRSIVFPFGPTTALSKGVLFRAVVLIGGVRDVPMIDGHPLHSEI